MPDGLRSLMDFRYQGKPIRVVLRDGEPWWVAKEVCEVLDIDVSTGVNGQWRTDKERGRYRSGGLDDDEKATHIVSTPGGHQEILVVNEPGLYALVLKSRKAEAKEFKRWITHEVIPSIRKTGSYSVQSAQPSPPPALSQMEILLQVVQNQVTLEKQNAELARRAEELQRQQDLLAADHEAIRDEVATWRQVREKAEADAAELPAAEGEVPDLNPRAALNRLVRAYCVENGIGHQAAWNRLYMEYRDRFHVDLKARAKGKKTPLDVAEELRAIKNLYALGMHLFGGKRKGVAS